MNSKNAHPIELGVVAALVVAESLLLVVVAAAALLLTLARWRPVVAPAAAAAEPEPVLAQQARPTPHPLAGLADRLAELPVTTLRQMANTRSKAIRKAQLIELIACS